MTESNEAREALVKTIGQHEPNVTSYDAGDLWGCGCGWEVVRDGTEWEQYAAHRADEILAAGWRPPARVIGTVAELEALPTGSVVLDVTGHVYQAELRERWGGAGSVRVGFVEDIDLPVTVLHEGGAA